MRIIVTRLLKMGIGNQTLILIRRNNMKLNMKYI